MPSISSKTVPPFFPLCPTCNQKMAFIALSPTCQSVIYEYLCRNDGDRLSWNAMNGRPPTEAVILR
jgi:hypothetical protein